MANPNVFLSVPQIALHFVEQIQSLSSTLTDELQQLIASLQAGLVSIVNTINGILDVWTDVPYDVSHISTTGAYTPVTNGTYVTRYKIIGKTMWVNIVATVTVTDATTQIVRVAIPGGLQPMNVYFNSADDIQRGAGIWTGGGTSGLALACINVSKRSIDFFRWDGVGGAFYPTAQIVVGAMMQIPLA